MLSSPSLPTRIVAVRSAPINIISGLFSLISFPLSSLTQGNEISGFGDPHAEKRGSRGCVGCFVLTCLIVRGVLDWDLQIEDHMSNPDTSHREKLYDT